MAKYARERPPAKRSRRVLTLLGVALAGVLALAFTLLRRPGDVALAAAVEPPRLVPLDGIRWPSLSSAQAPLRDAACRSLEGALGLYSRGDDDGGDCLIVEAVAALERAGAVAQEVGSYYYIPSARSLKRGDFIEADRRISGWLKKFPDDFDFLFLQGKCRFGTSRWAEAAESFRAACRVRPSSSDAKRWLAQTCAQLGAQDEAVRAVEGTLASIEFPKPEMWRHPLAPEILRNAIMVLDRFHVNERLAEVASAYRARFPDQGFASMALGLAFLNMGKFDAAVPLLQAALKDPENSPNREQIAFSLSLALSKQGEWAKAARVLSTLLEENPAYAKAYHQLGLVLSRLGRGAQAEAMTAKARELAPSERELRRETELRGAGDPGRAAAARARALELRGDFDEAEKSLRTPDLKGSPAAVLALADLYLECLRPADAEKVLQHAATLPGISQADVTGKRAAALSLRGDRAAAIAALRDAAEREGAGTVWKLELGRSLLGGGDAAGAERILAGLRKGDSDREASFLLARAALASGSPERALELLRSISTGDTRWDEWEGPAWLARAMLEVKAPRQEDIDEAARILEAVPAAGRGSIAYLVARVRLAERRQAPPEDLSKSREALREREAAQPAILEVSARVASTPWQESAAHRLALARLYHSAGEPRQAILHARLALAAEPGWTDGSNALADWLDGDGDVFFRLRALREAARARPDDAALKARLESLEAAWRDFAPAH